MQIMSEEINTGPVLGGKEQEQRSHGRIGMASPDYKAPSLEDKELRVREPSLEDSR